MALDRPPGSHLSVVDCFFKHSTDINAHIYVYTLISINARTPYPCEYLRETASKKFHLTGLVDKILMLSKHVSKF
jgi:hypothetical protein